ncbi:MAG: GGDEF domain-containing protein, partial [Cytophagaceae bacterium]
LRAVGLALQTAVRDSNLVFRYGGEEFLLLLPGVGAAAAEVRAEEIRSRIAALRVQHDGRELGPITVSVGLACAPADTDWQSLLQTADGALLHAKKAGRNQVVTATERRSA